jgi:hypothetical protein
MSTRGCIARLTSKEGEPITFSGTYLHWDNYLSGTGKTLFKLWRGHFKRDTTAMLKFLCDDHKAGFSTINGCDFNLPAGYKEFTSENHDKPHGPVCFCHGARSEEANEIDEKIASGSGVEYIYAFPPDGKRMIVLSSYTESGKKMIGAFGCGDPNATWKVVGEIMLAGKEPDWDVIPLYQEPRKRKFKITKPKITKADKADKIAKAAFKKTEAYDLMG